MKCPIDNNDLLMTERQGIEIDYCPTCRGVWLDRGELDKLIERGGESAPAHPQPRRDSYPSDEYKHHPRKHKRESMLGELFDF